jgi:phosphatidate cytidylyltransferase
VSNTATRIIVAVIAIPAIVAIAWLGGYAWAGFCAAVMIASLVEFAALCRAKGARPQTAGMIAAGLALILVFLHERVAGDVASFFDGRIPTPVQWQAFLWIVLVWMIVTLLVELFRNEGSPLLNMGATTLGALYIGLFLGSIVGVREIFTRIEFPVMRFFGTADLSIAQAALLDRWGAFTVIAVLASIWMCDTAAYFGGRAMGRHALFPRVSPKKTWEGTVWGFIGAVATMVAARALFLEYLAPVHAFVMGACIGTLGQLGDLVESLFKRDAAIKDSSALLPGHGGVFDRFDSLIFVSPALFLYLDFVVFA